MTSPVITSCPVALADRRRRRRPALVLCALLALAFALPLGACGKKGRPEPPKGAEEIQYPRPYPDPKSY